MEADALPIGPILKGAKELVEHTPGIVKVQTGKTTFLQAKNKWCLQNQESCTANNEIMYKELSFDKYGIKSLQIPSGWEVSLLEGESFCEDGSCVDFLSFTDSFYLTVMYSDTAGGDGTAHSLESILNPKRSFESFKKEIEEEVKRGIRNASFQIIESEGNVDRYVLKYTMSERAKFELGQGMVAQEMQGKVVFIEEDSFGYIIWFHNKQSEFASNADVYDHIENTFVTSHQSFWQNVLGLIAIIIAIGLIIAFVAWRITSSKKSKKKTKKKN